MDFEMITYFTRVTKSNPPPAVPSDQLHARVIPIQMAVPLELFKTPKT